MMPTFHPAAGQLVSAELAYARWAALRAKLRGERERRGLSLERLAMRIGVTGVALGSWERGDRRPGVPDVIRWAGALGLDLGFVVEPALDPLAVMHLIEAVDAIKATAGDAGERAA